MRTEPHSISPKGHGHYTACGRGAEECEIIALQDGEKEISTYNDLRVT